MTQLSPKNSSWRINPVPKDYSIYLTQRRYTGFRFDDVLCKDLEKIAKIEDRSKNNMIETILRNFADDYFSRRGNEELKPSKQYKKRRDYIKDK